MRQRVAQFRDQVGRRLSGELTEDEFKPLRLKNGVYLQLHAYMLRIAIPYGTMSARQLRKLAHIARTLRQGLRPLHHAPEPAVQLAQTLRYSRYSGGAGGGGDARHPDLRQQCMRNVTADHFAGATAEEVADPRPYAEIIRQWSSLHPEFSFLPRKFKIGITASEHDRSAIKTHDIGLHLQRLAGGGLGFAVWVGGGQGRTPYLAQLIRDALPEADLLSYIEAILRVYNLHGRRDNIHKARIKILINSIGIEAFRGEVEAEWVRIRDGVLKLPEQEIARIEAYFAPPRFAARPPPAALRPADRSFDRWVTRNTHAHKQPGYAIVTITLKPIGGIPGDASAAQMDAIADIAQRFSCDEVRVSHEQNLVLPHATARRSVVAVSGP